MSAQDSRDTLDAGGDELEDVLAVWRRSLELDLRVALPAQVTAYDSATQTASLLLGLVPVHAAPDGSPLPQPPIPCPDVPVAWPGGAAGYVTTPLVAGDTGIVVFADRCIAEWRRQGAPVDPINRRTHALGDAMFIPGLRARTNPITPPTDLTATVVEGPLVRLGAQATSGVIVDAGGAQAALVAAVGVLNAITGVGPDGPNVEAIAAALLAVVQALQVSTKVLAAPAP